MDGYGKRVLVAEDDDAVRALICSVLTDAGYNVYEACDGLEAIDSLKKRRYDVLLTDYHMPKMDGVELRPRAGNVARIAGYFGDQRHLANGAAGACIARAGLRHFRQAVRPFIFAQYYSIGRSGTSEAWASEAPATGDDVPSLRLAPRQAHP